MDHDDVSLVSVRLSLLKIRLALAAREVHAVNDHAFAVLKAKLEDLEVSATTHVVLGNTHVSIGLVLLGQSRFTATWRSDKDDELLHTHRIPKIRK
jgi:hypothetical protein